MGVGLECGGWGEGWGEDWGEGWGEGWGRIVSGIGGAGRAR